MTKVCFAGTVAIFDRETERWKCPVRMVENVLNSTLPLGGFSPADGIPSYAAAERAKAAIGARIVSKEKLKQEKGLLY